MKTVKPKLITLREEYNKYLDRKARHIAFQLKHSKPVTKLLLSYISELYQSAKIKFFDNDHFRSAYHNPISSDLEFLIARILYNYSNFNKLGWSVFLRSQVGKTAPDIRVTKGEKTIAILEIKAKAGWIQHLFSEARYEEFKRRLKEKKTKGDPDELLRRVKEQLKKYYDSFNIGPSQYFMMLPSFALVHRKRSESRSVDYEKWFSLNSGLQRKNLILLSNNLTLDLSSNQKQSEYQPTDRFEKFILRLGK